MREVKLKDTSYVNFGGGEFSDDLDKNKRAGLLVADHKKISQVFKGEKCRYSVERKDYLDSIETMLQANVFETTDDTNSFMKIQTENNLKTKQVIHFNSENQKRTEYVTLISNGQIVDIRGNGIIFLNLKGQVITKKKKILLTAKKKGLLSFSSYYFLEDDPNYTVISTFPSTQSVDIFSDTRSILKRQHKIDAKANK